MIKLEVRLELDLTAFAKLAALLILFLSR